jgi:cytochrome c556
LLLRFQRSRNPFGEHRMPSLKTRSALATAALGLAAALTALPAAAQFQKPEDAVKYRKSAMFVMANHFGRIGAMANGRVPFDANAAQVNAEVVATMSKLPFAGFIEGTDKGETRAKPEIWSEPEKFRAAAQKMQEEVAKLNTAAKTGNLDQIKAAFGEAGKACKACHDSYQKPAQP